jgi:hypothetical protein
MEQPSFAIEVMVACSPGHYRQKARTVPNPAIFSLDREIIKESVFRFGKRTNRWTSLRGFRRHNKMN